MSAAPIPYTFGERPSLGLSLRGVSKTFGATKALDNIDLEIEAGEMTALLGPSGSGKSTLLRLSNGLLASDPTPDSSIKVGSDYIQKCGAVSPQARQIRSRIGFIFQRFNLVARLSLHRNVMVGACAKSPPLRTLFLWDRPSDRHRAMQALAAVGLDHCAAQRASTLSGGQQQRGAIARAIMQGAEIILADEPIASLDPESARRVMALLRQLNLDWGITVIVSLHQPQIARDYCRRVVGLKQGRIRYDGPPDELDDATLQDLYESNPGAARAAESYAASH